ncbi:hypothetical protein H310_13044 [Aphanomyces invadans]|uniref:Uncharacterized protein n=1 Tax=Aphanomyces invadans TaxID=157072 RepID=A0A024TFN4_9STRA|nr:hypothetical protein H310_13044 [Aphanomyces invadans]ETV92853.1 hypothetical protein H310_13044 [Aphanomyces invadans]|eukprot:XP_008878623.1 hypothetical protein H310_13044 [Aphanomyces invadans]
MESLLQSLAQPTFTVDSTTKLTCSDDFNLLLDAIQDADEPNVRLKMARLALLWLPLPELSMAQVVGCIHILAMDIWSQIRKDVAVAVGRVVPAFPWATVEAILHDLLQVCKTPDEDWKALEGAFGVVASMLNQFQKTSPSGFRLGSRTMQYLPSALLCDLKPAVYLAMQHTQLSVREQATTAMIRYVALSDAFTQISTFQEVMSKLNLYSPHEVLPAAHAEGLLDVAAQLVPHIPLAFLTKHWQVVFPTCEKYVMHVASTVRQKSAGLIGALAELSVDHVEAIPLLSSILESLALPCSQHPEVNQRDFFWQRMEGRLMGIESVMHVLGTNTLLHVSPALLAPVTKPTPRGFHSYRETVDDLMHFDHVYATSFGSLATWTGGAASTPPNHAILTHLRPDLVHTTWHAYIQHAYVCFQSPQYELKRMAVQTLPGLVRLSMWLSDPTRFVPEWLAAARHVQPTFLCLVIKSLALHSRFVEETASSAAGDPSTIDPSLVKPICTQAHVVLQALLPPLLAVNLTEPVDKALGMAVVEAGALLVLQTTTTSTLDKHHAQLVHAILNVLWGYHSNEASVDRAMSSITVRYLPGLARFDLTPDQATILIRVSLAWLAATDSLRWIVVDGSEARCHLADALVLLALRSRPGLSCVWKVADVTAAIMPLLRHPQVPLRLFSKLLVLVSAVAALSPADELRPLLHALLAPEITLDSAQQSVSGPSTVCASMTRTMHLDVPRQTS